MSMIRVLQKGVESRASSTLANPASWLGEAFGSFGTFSNETINGEVALQIGSFFACVRLLGMTAGMLPLMVYSGEGRDRSRARDSQQWQILHEYPNSETAADVFLQTVMGDLIIGDGRFGDFFAEKIRFNSGPQKGQVGELWRIDPNLVSVERQTTGGPKVYKIQSYGQVYDDTRILHIPGYASGGLRGTSFVWMARQDLGTAIGRERYEGNFYANGATFPGFLSTEGVLSEDAAKRIAAQWHSAHAGNKHKTPVLEAGLTYHPTGSAMRDQQFAELARLTANKVARWFGIDPEMIGGDRSSDTYATVEGRALHFLTFALDPWLVRIEKGLKRDQDLFNVPGLFPEFLRSALLRVDAKTRWDIYSTGRNVGAYSPNDILNKENEPPREGGDTYLDTPSGTAPVAPAASNGRGHIEPHELAQLDL